MRGLAAASSAFARDGLDKRARSLWLVVGLDRAREMMSSGVPKAGWQVLLEGSVCDIRFSASSNDLLRLCCDSGIEGGLVRLPASFSN